MVDGTLRGYAYGSPWSVKNKAEIGFFYVGESSESALKQKLSGLEAVLISSKNAVESLTSRPESQKSSEKSKITPDLSL